MTYSTQLPIVIAWKYSSTQVKYVLQLQYVPSKYTNASLFITSVLYIQCIQHLVQFPVHSCDTSHITNHYIFHTYYLISVY